MNQTDPSTSINDPYALANYGMDDGLYEKFVFSEGGSLFHVRNKKSSEDCDHRKTSILGLGFGHLLTGVYSIYYLANRILLADEHFDFEAKVESVLRLLGLPMAMANSAEGVIIFFLFITTITLSSLVFGTAFLLIEFGLEIYRLYKVYALKNNLAEKDISELLQIFQMDPEGTIPKKIQEIESYVSLNQEKLEAHLGKENLEKLKQFLKLDPSIHALEYQLRLTRTILTERKISALCKEYLTLTASDNQEIELRTSQEMKKSKKQDESFKKETREKHVRLMHEGKLDKLSRRIGSSMAMKLKEYHLHLSYETNHHDLKNAEKTSRRMYTQLCEQSKKAIVVHIVGLVAIFSGAVALALSYFAYPLAPILSVAVITFTLQFARVLLPASYLDQEGNKFSLEPQKNWILDSLGRNTRVIECIEMKSLA